MASSKAEAQAGKAEDQGVEVKLLCIYSGDGWSLNPGEVISLPADEAQRLIDIGAAEAV